MCRFLCGHRFSAFLSKYLEAWLLDGMFSFVRNCLSSKVAVQFCTPNNLKSIYPSTLNVLKKNKSLSDSSVKLNFIWYGFIFSLLLLWAVFFSIILLYVLKFWFVDSKKNKRGRELLTLFLSVLWSPFSGDISSASIDWLDSSQEIRSGNDQGPALWGNLGYLRSTHSVCKCLDSIPGHEAVFFLLAFQSPERHISHSSRQRPTVIYFSFLWALTSSLTLNSESSSGLPFSAAPWLCVPVALQEVCTCSRLRVQQTCSFGPAHSFVYLSYFCSRWRPVLFLSLFSSL